MSIHYTMGGIRINELAQAMRADGRPVAGLWAAGEATGGIHGKERLGGNGINDARCVWAHCPANKPPEIYKTFV